MKVKRLLFGLLAILCVQFTASAQTAATKVKDKQINQQKRIRQGVKSDQLTKKETMQLQQQQQNVQQHKKAIKSDGVVTQKERAKLKAHQAKASKNIYRKKNN